MVLFFQRDGVGLVFWRKFIEQGDQFAARGGDAYFPFADYLFGGEFRGAFPRRERNLSSG